MNNSIGMDECQMNGYATDYTNRFLFIYFFLSAELLKHCEYKNGL